MATRFAQRLVGKRAIVPTCALLGSTSIYRHSAAPPKDESNATSTASAFVIGRRTFCHSNTIAELRTPYPPFEPNEVNFLTTSDGKYKLYYEVSGNPKGKPALFLHGGPGDGSSPKHRQLFDPATYRIVVFDQRGAGQSCPETPGGELDGNTADLLVEDIEQLRKHLGINDWGLIVGGSWGSTLALAYATKHAAKVSGLVLYSIFVPSKESIMWPYSAQGAGAFFPEAYEEFLQALPEQEQSDPLAAYARRLASSDPSVHLPARRSYSLWILRLLSVAPDEAMIREMSSHPEEAGTGPAIEMHYMVNNCFLDANQLLDDCAHLAHIKCHIIHGRNDLLCAPSGAWTVRKRLPQAQFTMVPLAGHSSSLAPALKSAVIEAIDAHR
mmetsp:Transcript_51359/g.94925  ORF Transcript_51359/g.94925 Transcript_51359/m.94925 type:complete len:384 (+) Transcript_51359:27-1178(+)